MGLWTAQSQRLVTGRDMERPARERESRVGENKLGQAVSEVP